MPKLTEAHRAYIYRVSAALLLVLGAYGVVADEKIPLILGVVGALFPTGLAVKNTSTKAG